MKKLPVITAFLLVITIVMAGTVVPGSSRTLCPLAPSERQDDTVDVAIATAPLDSLPPAETPMGEIVADTVPLPAAIPDPLDGMDSLQREVYLKNKAIDDSLYRDSLNRQRANGIDAPVYFSSEDSMVYLASTKKAYLYGSSKVKYEQMDLEAENVDMNMDNNLVHATGAIKDTISGELEGTPQFTMGTDSYESDTMTFNFKTKKGLIRNAYTEQEDGFMISELSKRAANGDIYMQHGRYTTCNADHPDFYIALSRAKVRPGKDVVFGPAHLVIADVPVPLAIPYGFFPFSSKYSSGFIMPSYGDESARGFYLHNGGYYFAVSDKMDVKLIGEIYTKGSWGISATSNYTKRYKFRGTFLFSYQDTRTGDKGLPDYQRTESFKVQWNHTQDSKANPFNTFSASVNFATSSFEKNNLTSMYNPQSMTQSTRTSSVSWGTRFSSLGLQLSSTFNLSQNMRDSSIAITLPDLNISFSRFYPFKRKHAVGKERWYEKIAMSYTGHISNSYSGKEAEIMHSNLARDWRNGWNHSVPVSGSFTLFDYINVSPSFNFTDRTYFSKVNRSWDEDAQREVCDTTYGFHNVYNWNLSLGLSTKLYGFYKPSRKIFGDKIDAVRHVLTPSFSLSYAPDFSASHYGYYETYMKTDRDGNVSMVEYSPYQGMLYGVPGKGKTGSMSFSLSNNVEMKVRDEDAETGFRKISIIDELGASMSYNMAAKERPWSDLSTRLRLKLSKSYTFNMNAVFATYAYELDENGRPYIGNRTEYSYGRFGRFQGTSQNISLQINPEKLRKWFGRKDKDSNDYDDTEDYDDEGMDTDVESNIDDEMVNAQKNRGRRKAGKAETDSDGYMKFKMPWSINISYGVNMRENRSGKFNEKRMRYPYQFTHNLNFSGNISLADGWNISFSSGYDFATKGLSMTTASLSRDLHCFNMSCNIVLAPYTSYNFSFRCNAATLTDVLKYDKKSGVSNNIRWY